MEDVAYHEVVIVCEACHFVEKVPVRSYEECLDRFKGYQCPNGCGPNLYSYFTVGQVKK